MLFHRAPGARLGVCSYRVPANSLTVVRVTPLGRSGGRQVRLAEEFAERMLRTMNEAALALMVSVGHRTGLFDAMAGMPPATSAGIAAASGLNERYVREWLGAMVTAGVVEH